jgi:hypothetical protein
MANNSFFKQNNTYRFAESPYIQRRQTVLGKETPSVDELSGSKFIKRTNNLYISIRFNEEAEGRS